MHRTKAPATGPSWYSGWVMHKSARQFVSVVALLACAALTASCARAGTLERGAELRVTWVLPREFPAQVSMHRITSGGEPPLLRTYERGVSPELDTPIENGVLRVELDRSETLLVVVRNPLDRPVRFWVAPHLPVPHSAESALMIRCLCTGETYEVPAGGTWVRAVQIGIRRRQAVERMTVAHVVTLGEAPTMDSYSGASR